MDRGETCMDDQHEVSHVVGFEGRRVAQGQQPSPTMHKCEKELPQVG